MKDTFRGGVHPAGRKELSRDVPLREFLPTGEMVFPQIGRASCRERV